MYTGPMTFAPRVHTAVFPTRFRVSTKYTGDAHADTWLADSARVWLTSLSEGCILNWGDLEKLFVNYFQGSYKRSGNASDLHLSIQNEGKPFRDYIQHFSRKKNSLSDVREGASSPVTPL